MPGQWLRLSPCKHRLCSYCAPQLKRCPLCRVAIGGFERAASGPPALLALAIRMLGANFSSRIAHDPRLAALGGAVRRSLFRAVTNRRLLYGAPLRTLVLGARVTELRLPSAVNIKHDDLQVLRLLFRRGCP